MADSTPPPLQPPSPPPPDRANDALILGVLREVLARQAVAESAAALEPAPTVVAPRVGAPVERVSTMTNDRLWIDPDSGLTRAELDRVAEYEARANEPPEPLIGVARSLQRLLIGVLLAAAVVNVPLVHGRPLTQAMPDREALIIRDGLLLRGAGPEVFVLEDGHKRWISSLTVFEANGFAWDDVHLVDADYLATFPDGRPIYALLKCDGSPHVYRIEDGRKRWIKDIVTFQAEGHRWEDIIDRDCNSLALLPFGPSIPPDAGWPDEDASTGDVPGTGAVPATATP